MFCIVLCLCGCSALTTKNNITNLLSAPKQNENESSIVAAIEDYLGEDISLKYSKNQGYTAPVQLIDIDFDDVQEAVVFYYAPNKGANIRFALLARKDGKWNIVADKEGLGTEVFYFDTIVLPYVYGRQITVGYQSANIDENFFVTYFTDKNIQLPDYAESCRHIVTGDMTGNGYSDVILAKVSSYGNVSLNILSFTEDLSFESVGVKSLKYTNIELAQLVVDYLRDGRRAVFADYTDTHNRMHTEVYALENGRMVPCLTDGIVTNIWEHEPVIASRDIDNDGYLETATVIQPQTPEEVPSFKYIQWSDRTSAEQQKICYGVFDVRENIFMAIPDQWRDMVYTKALDNGFEIKNIETDETMVKLVEIESADNVESGAYSYTVYIGTRLWHLECSTDMNMTQVEYVYKGITDFD